jgi:hypothetical protein
LSCPDAAAMKAGESQSRSPWEAFRHCDRLEPDLLDSEVGVSGETTEEEGVNLLRSSPGDSSTSLRLEEGEANFGAR